MKAIKVVFAVLAIVAISAGVFAFSKRSSNKFSTHVFQYSGPRPVTASSALDPNNWPSTSSPSYTSPAEILSAIEFDDATYPLVNNRPDFAGQSTLSTTVMENYGDATKHLQTINGVKFYFSTAD
jgi:hypothetical protein